MKRMKRAIPSTGERIITSTMRAIDISVAILLLTGQLTVAGVFVASGAIWFTVVGSVLGSYRYEGQTPNANVLVDGIDVITAFLLILGQLTHCGPWISSGHFNLVVSGPAFGNTTAIPVPISSSKTSQKAHEFFGDFTNEILVRELNKVSNMAKRP